MVTLPRYDVTSLNICANCKLLRQDHAAPSKCLFDAGSFFTQQTRFHLMFPHGGGVTILGGGGGGGTGKAGHPGISGVVQVWEYE